VGNVDINPAKVGVDNPVRRRKEQHPFESWAELEAIAADVLPHLAVPCPAAGGHDPGARRFAGRGSPSDETEDGVSRQLFRDLLVG
jgi:hypothetical protein